MAKKIVITGAEGLLGQELTSHFQSLPGWEVFPLSHKDLNITDALMTEKSLIKLAPDVVINCAVIISVDKCEADPKLAYAVNRDGVKNLLEASAKLPSLPLFIQISSSEVFGGWEQGTFKKEGYTEEDKRDPRSVYQKSKAEAEDIVAAFAKNLPSLQWYIVRAAWFFGKGRDTFVEQFLRQLRNHEELTPANDQWRSPTWTKDFVEELGRLIEKKPPSGIYHIVNEGGSTTVMEVIEEIRKFLDIPKEEVKIKIISIYDLFKVPRAPSNVLINTKLPPMRSWRGALREYLETQYADLRSN